jgi:phospholipid/cholesterol/gamma-HCH transport system permease protein
MLLLTYSLSNLSYSKLANFCRSVFQRIFQAALNLKNSFVNAFTWESLFIVGRRYWIHHWFGFTLQSRPTLLEFGAVSWMPSMVTIIREIGPIITALICAGRIGSGIGAELGSMRVTEQIDAMEVSGTNPFKYLVVTQSWLPL